MRKLILTKKELLMSDDDEKLINLNKNNGKIIIAFAIWFIVLFIVNFVFDLLGD